MCVTLGLRLKANSHLLYSSVKVPVGVLLHVDFKKISAFESFSYDS